MNKIATMPIIISALVFGLVGFGIGQWRAGYAAEDLRSQIEELQGKVKRADESVSNIGERVSLSESYRHTTMALVALDESNEESARQQLHSASLVLGSSKAPKISEIADRAQALAEQKSLLSHKEAVRSLTGQYEELIPKAISMSGPTQN